MITNNPINAAMLQAMTKITGKSAGDGHQAFLQAMGMDQRTAAYQGALQDLKLGDLHGYQKNMFEAFTGVEPGRMSGMAPPHAMCSPSQYMGASFERVNLKKALKHGLGSVLAGAGAGFALGGPLGALAGGFLGGKVGRRLKARALERRLNRDPGFRAQFESAVGGRYVPDGRRDGKITIMRPNYGLPGMSPGMMSHLSRNPITGSAMSGMARHMMGIQNMMAAMGGGGFNAIGGAGFNTAGAYGHLNPGVAPGIGTHASLRTPGYTGGVRGGSEMSKLGPGATFEDKVAAFMVDMAVKMQKEVEDKMAELEASSNSGGQGGKNSGIGGMFRGLAGVAGGAIGGAFGGPVGAGIGQQVGQAVGGGGGQQGRANGADETGNQRQIQMEKLKNLINVMQQMIQSMSNILNTMHQGAMNAIRNIR
jgi:hypothetical protein